MDVGEWVGGVTKRGRRSTREQCPPPSFPSPSSLCLKNTGTVGKIFFENLVVLV